MIRKLSIFGLVICIAALAAAYYLEYEYMLAVCPLCVLQRIVFYALAFVFLLGVLAKINKYWRYPYALLIMLFSSLGLLFAGRQLWLQYFAPPQEISCSASLQRLIQVHPILDALKIAIVGSGECAEIDFTILGLSLAGWSLLLFAVLFVSGIVVLRKGR